jgi:energy-coupling factor transporter transmembrane protein EcfT
MRHLYEKYFSYRRRYVDYILKEAPQRARLAVMSEIARLGFVAAGAGLCAFIFGALLAGLPQGTGWRWLTFIGALALAAALSAALGVAGATVALFDLGRVEEQSRR